MDYKDFVSKPYALLIAPAGYGKTYSISACLEHAEGKQLILTHTHAGVSSIKDKIKKAGLSSSRFHIETIVSYAQKYVLAFYTKKDIPDQEIGNEYYSFIIRIATELIKLKPVSKIISISYKGLFVDEYQDCTITQHKFITALSEILPTRILGDPLQGIFDFEGEPLINLNDVVEIGKFNEHKYELNEPWRWKNVNDDLGNTLKEIRNNLQKTQPIDLSSHPSIEHTVINEPDLYNPAKPYYRYINGLLSETSLLIIHPDTSNINARKKIIQTFHNAFRLVEAIDDKDFYKIAKKLDEASVSTIEKTVRDISYKLFDSTTLNNWFNEKGLKSKTKQEDKEIIEPIVSSIREKLKTVLSFIVISEVFKKISKFSGIKCYRKELFNSICDALEAAEYGKTSVYQAMVAKRNRVRRIGRKIYGKCIGTTLLTKGLEFETVVVLNAHKFQCHKNLYVAFTRASKRLIVFTTNPILSPYDNLKESE